MKRLADIYASLLDEFVELAAVRVLASNNPFYSTFTLPSLRAIVRRAFEATGKDLELSEPVHFTALMAMRGTQLSATGVRCQDLLAGIGMGFQVVSDVLAERFSDEAALRISWEQARSRATTFGLAALADAYLASREQLVRAQSQEILELSVRVLPLWRGVLLMPLVGRLDADRAERMVGALLEAVGQHQSRVVLLDLTGLPAVDLEVASHLVRAASAVRLLGATPALVGVRASIAHAMARGGVDLGGVKTLSTLEEGLRFASAVRGASSEAK